PVAVGGGAEILVGADAQAGAGGVTQMGVLAGQVDAAAARAAPAQGGIRAADDFHAFQVEDFARLAAGVADSVHVDVAGRGSAADEGPVGQGLAAFAGAEGDARRIAQHVFQRGGVGV